MSLAGKVALITGASKGIGKATALRLARDGASIVVNYASDAKSADTLVHSIGIHRALAVKADVSKVAEIEKMVKQAVDKFGKIDILVPCAGMLPMSPLESTTEELFDNIFALNVKGPYFLVQVRTPIPPPSLTPSPSPHHNSSANTHPESSPPHAPQLARDPHLHHPHGRLDRHAAVPAVPRDQRRHRTDGPRDGEGPGPQGHLRQRHLPGPDEHGALHAEPDGADAQGALGHEPQWPHRAA